MERSVALRGYNAKLHSPLLNASPLLTLRYGFTESWALLATVTIYYKVFSSQVPCVKYEGISEGVRVVGPMHYFWIEAGVFYLLPCYTPVLTKARRAEGGR